MARAAFSKKKTLYTSKLDLNFRKKVVKCYIWSINLYGAANWILQKIHQKYLENLKIWCWRKTEKISCKKRGFKGVKEKRNILQTIKRRKLVTSCVETTL